MMERLKRGIDPGRTPGVGHILYALDDTQSSPTNFKPTDHSSLNIQPVDCMAPLPG